MRPKFHLEDGFFGARLDRFLDPEEPTGFGGKPSLILMAMNSAKSSARSKKSLRAREEFTWVLPAELAERAARKRPLLLLNGHPLGGIPPTERKN